MKQTLKERLIMEAMLKEEDEQGDNNIDLLAKHIENKIDGLYNYKDLIKDVNTYGVKGRAGMQVGKDPEYAFGEAGNIYHVKMDKKWHVLSISKD